MVAVEAQDGGGPGEEIAFLSEDDQRPERARRPRGRAPLFRRREGDDEARAAGRALVPDAAAARGDEQLGDVQADAHPAAARGAAEEESRLRRRREGWPAVGDEHMDLAAGLLGCHGDRALRLAPRHAAGQARDRGLHVARIHAHARVEPRAAGDPAQHGGGLVEQGGDGDHLARGAQGARVRPGGLEQESESRIVHAIDLAPDGGEPVVEQGLVRAPGGERARPRP